MRHWLWTNGRFTWPFVTAIVFLSLLVLIADLAWRVLVIPAETLIILVVVACVVGALALFAICRMFRTSARLN